MTPTGAAVMALAVAVAGLALHLPAFYFLGVLGFTGVVYVTRAEGDGSGPSVLPSVRAAARRAGRAGR